MITLNKTLLVSALTAAALSSAQAAEPLTLYGKLNVTVQSNDEAGVTETAVQSNASRLGVKGDFELNDALQAFYGIEYEIDVGNDAKENFVARDQFVGLKGEFGAISAGRQSTMLKVSQGKVDLFNDLSGDIKHLFKGENRIEQTVTYVSPSFNGFSVGATYAAEASESQAGEDGFSVAAIYGDASLKTSPVYAAVAYDSEVKGYDVLRATVQAKLADLILGGMYQQQEQSVNGDSEAGFLVSAAYQLADVTLKGQYQDMENQGNSWSVGADYKLAKPTKLLAFYTSRDLDGAVDTDNYLGVGIEHKF